MNEFNTKTAKNVNLFVTTSFAILLTKDLVTYMKIIITGKLAGRFRRLLQV